MNEEEEVYNKIIQGIIEDKGGSEKDYRSLLDNIAFHESAGTMDPTIHQYGGGPGRGKYQFEGAKGSNRILTSANRTKSYLKSIGAPVPKYINTIINNGTGDASHLSSTAQDILVLGDLRMKNGVDLGEYITGDLSIQDLWADHWWAGSKDLRDKKIKSFNNSMFKFNSLNNNVRASNSRIANERPQQQLDGIYNARLDDIEREISKQNIPTLDNNIQDTGAGTNDSTSSNISLSSYLNDYFKGDSLNEFNSGGTHEQNPNGGIVQGIGANGKPNTVEENETSFDLPSGKFIFSDRIDLAGKGQYFTPSNEFATGGPIDPPNQKRKLKDSPLNKGYEMAKEDMKFLKDWMNSDRFDRKLKENILEADNLRSDPKYKGFIDTYFNDIDEDTKKAKVEALKSLNETSIYGNDISNKDKDKLSKAYQDLYGETEGGRKVREHLAYGLHNSEGDAIWLNRRDDGTPLHELTHSADLDGLMSKISPRSKIYNEVVDTFKQRYPDRENLDLSLSGLRGPNVGGRVRPYGILLPRYETVANEKDIDKVLDSLSKRDNKQYNIDDLRYLDSSHEVYPRIMEIRKKANLNPDDVIDDKKMKEIYESTKGEPLYKYYSKDQVKEMLNKFAGINNTQSNINVAKYGGKINTLANGGSIDPPSNNNSVINESKSFVSNWLNDPITRDKLSTNLKDYGQAQGLINEGLTNVANTNTSVFSEGTGAQRAEYNMGNISTYGTPTKRDLVHEYTHASGVDRPLSEYITKNYGSPLESIRTKQGTGSNTKEAIQKQFGIDGDTVFGKDKINKQIEHGSYIGREGELYPRVMEARQFLNLKPGQEVTDDMIERLYKAKNNDLINYYDKKQLKNMLNTVASNNNTNNYRNLV